MAPRGAAATAPVPGRRPPAVGGPPGAATLAGGAVADAAADAERARLAEKWRDVGERRRREQQNYMRSQKAAGSEATNPRCFIDVSHGDAPLGRICVELFADVVPATAENFRGLCTGEYGTAGEGGPRIDLIDSVFHRVVPSSRDGGGFIVGGDITDRAGSGGESVFRAPLPDESLRHKHQHPGLLSMVSRGPNSATSQFCITTARCPHLDYRQVVFGRVTDGLSVVEKMENAPIDRNCVPRRPLRVTFCGQQNKTAPYRPAPDAPVRVAQRVPAPSRGEAAERAQPP